MAAVMPDELDASPLVLVRGRAEDAQELLDAVEASIDELRQWMAWAQAVPTLDRQRAVLADGGAAFDAGTDFGYVFREASGGMVVGAGGVHRRVGAGAVEIGYWVRSDRHGRGYATRAVGAMTDAVFACLEDVDRIEIHMDRANLASARIPPKLGYRLLHTERRPVLALAHTGEALVWQTTRAERTAPP